MIKLLLLLLQFWAATANNVGAHLGQAGESLAHLPMQQVASAANASNVVSEELPSFYDLAISRLQSKTDEVISGLWESLEDKRRYVQLSENGISRGVLETIGLLRNDIFALEQQLDRARFERSLKTLAVPQDEAPEWLKTQKKFANILGMIKLHWSIFDNYMLNADGTSQLELEDFARSIIQPGSTQRTAMLTTLDDLNSMAIPDASNSGRKRNDIMHNVADIFARNQENMCNLEQSPSQFLTHLYTLIALNEIKGYIMVQFSYVVFKMYGHDSLTMEMDIQRRKFQTNTAYKISFAKEILETVSQDFWHCDHKNPKEGVHYIRMTKLLQGHLENEVDLNNLQSCRDNCAAYKVAEPLGCYKNMFCAKQSPCQGRLFDCQFFNADAWVCMSQNRQRKYDWIEYENGIKLGPTQNQCINQVKVDSWWRFLFHCSYCLCLCDSPSSDSDRFWSLQSQESDIANNKIVTGVRFVKKNRVIHLEIEQATALREGNVDDHTRQWIEAVEIDVNNQTQKELGLFKTMKYEERALDLDDLKTPKGYVITGVRLRNLGGHLNLEIRMTPIRFASGKLITERTVWKGNDNTPASLDKRTPLLVISPDVPTKYMGMSKIDSLTNQYVLFDATDAYKDVSQTTIPYIDSQPVAPKVPAWLSAIGLYHKGSVGYGGYVGLKVSTYDFSRHFVPKKLDKNLNEIE